MVLKNEDDLQNSAPLNFRNKRKNLTKAEIEAKKNLLNNKDIIIKKADKGSAVVVQNYEGLCQLSDRDFYRLQEGNLTEAHNLMIKTQIDKMVHNKEISPKTADYLFLDNPRTTKCLSTS